MATGNKHPARFHDFFQFPLYLKVPVVTRTVSHPRSKLHKNHHQLKFRRTTTITNKQLIRQPRLLAGPRRLRPRPPRLSRGSPSRVRSTGTSTRSRRLPVCRPRNRVQNSLASNHSVRNRQRQQQQHRSLRRPRKWNCRPRRGWTEVCPKTRKLTIAVPLVNLLLKSNGSLRILRINSAIEFENPEKRGRVPVLERARSNMTMVLPIKTRQT